MKRFFLSDGVTQWNRLEIFACCIIALVGGLQLQVPVFTQRAAAQQQDESEWRHRRDEPGTAYLFKGGVQIGGYNYAQGYWISYDAATDTWGDKVFCKREDVPAIVDRVRMPTGVNWDKISPTPKIKLHDKKGDSEISKAKAIEEIEKVSGKEEIPDDSKKFRLTVIGSPAERKMVTDAWNQVEAELKNRVVTWSVPPDHWSLKDEAGKASFKSDGHPTVYLQAPGGQVLHRQDSFASIEDFNAVRKGVKAYDQNKDPDLRKPQPSPLLPGGSNPLFPVGVVLGGLALFVFLTKGKSQ